MKALSLRQAQNCETSEGEICRCRCQGVYHGISQSNRTAPARSYFEHLHETDPHHLLTEEEIKRRRRDRRGPGQLRQPLVQETDIERQRRYEEITTGMRS